MYGVYIAFNLAKYVDGVDHLWQLVTSHKALKGYVTGLASSHVVLVTNIMISNPNSRTIIQL